MQDGEPDAGDTEGFAEHVLAEFPGSLKETEAGFSLLIQVLTEFGFEGLEQRSQALHFVQAKRQEHRDHIYIYIYIAVQEDVAKFETILSQAIRSDIGALRLKAMQVASDFDQLKASYDAKKLRGDVQSELEAIWPMALGQKRARLA